MGRRIGKSLSERFGAMKSLSAEVATRTLEKVIGERGKDVVAVRAQGPDMIACVVVDADDAAVRLCRSIGLEVTRGGTAVFGLRGTDCAAVLPPHSASQRSWLEAPCGARETKVVLVAGGLGFLTIEAEGGKTVVRTV